MTTQRTPECIRLLHISDLHFGSDHGFFADGNVPEPGGAELDLAEVLLGDLRAINETRIDGLIVSGDLMTHARWLEHAEDALSFLKKLTDGLNVPRARTYIIPGNHDYEWYQEQAQGGFVRKALKPSQKANFIHEVQYKNFLRLFYEDDRPMAGEIFEIPGDKFRIKLGLLNSCKLVPSQFHEYGYLSLGQIKDLMNKINTASAQPEIRILVMHHHISSIIPAEPPKDKADISVTLDAGRLIDRALEASVDLVIHGHQHYPCISKISKTRFVDRRMQCFTSDAGMFILSAGSAGV